MASNKFSCRECGWSGHRSDLLTAPHPFQAGRQVCGCPACGAIDSMELCCEEVGCWKIATAGARGEAGDIVQTCDEHRR